MPTDYGPHPYYNKEFAREVIRAYVMGKRNFKFMKTNYRTKEYINNVRNDINNGFYSLKRIYL